MKLFIKSEVIKALLVITPSDDVNRTLNGVCIDVRENDVTLVTTDRHRLLMVPIDSSNVNNRVIGQYIIPRDALEQVKPHKAGPGAYHQVILEINTQDYFELYCETLIAGHLIYSKYPEWRKIVPSTSSGEPSLFRPKYVGDFGIIANLLWGDFALNNPPVIHQSGMSAALVSNLGCNALGILMPMTYSSEKMQHPELPTWAI